MAVNIFPSAEQIVQFFAVLQPEEPVPITVEGSPYDEIENTLKQVKIIRDDKESRERFLTLVHVLYQSLVPCPVATPLVYLSDESWKLSDYAEFRSSKRKQLKTLEEALKGAIDAASQYDTRERIAELVEEFETVLKEVLHVRIPAMPNLYITENYYDMISISEACNNLCGKLATVKKYEVKSRIHEMTKVMLEWFLLCPVGRPVIYASDTEWTTITESSLRASYRAELVK